MATIFPILKTSPAMSEKMSTLVLKVDLDCSRCYNKLKKTLCHYQYEIRSQLIDHQQHTVTVSGPFDPEEFAKKLKNMAGVAIKSIETEKLKKAVTFAQPLKAAPVAETGPPQPAEPGPGMKYVDPGPVLVYPTIQPYGGYTVPSHGDYVGGGPVYDGYGRPLLGYDWGYGGNTAYYDNNDYNNSTNTNNSYNYDYFSEKDPTCRVM